MSILSFIKSFFCISVLFSFLFLNRVILAAETDLGGSFAGTSTYSKDVNTTNIGDKLAKFLSNMIGFVTTIAGLYFLFYFLFGAVSWITAGGETQKLTVAKDKMINAAIGLCIVIASYSVIMIISQVLGIDFLDIQGTLDKITKP